jgi:trimeric autotransporter adhesin
MIQDYFLCASRYCVRLLVTAAALSIISISNAQIKSGTITGLVTDKSGAVIPDASVSVTNEETQISNKGKTDGSGEYSVPYLAPGRYTITVEKEGFSVFKETGVVLGTAQQLRVDLQLALGRVGTTVQVQAEAVSLQTEGASVEGRVDSNVIASVPDLNHNPFYFATLSAGIVARNELASTTNPYSFGVGMYSRDRLSAFSVNGAQAFSTDITVDGVSVMGATMNEALVLPNRDGIEEVRTITNNFTAEYGRGQGAVAVITKSGTNSYHGSAFYQLRNEDLNANTFGNNALGIVRPPFKVDYFGGTIGGPIIKNKVFFFVGYEGLTHNTAADWLDTVPTPLQKAGNFSQTLVNVNGVPTPVQLFDPFNVTQTGPNLYQRAPIPNAIISNPNPYALKLYSYYPDPNRVPTDVYNANNYFFRGLQTTRKDDINARIDYHMGRQSFYGTGGIHRGNIETPQPWGASNPFYNSPNSGGIAPIVSDSNPYIGIGDTIVLSPTLVADVRAGLQRIDTKYATPLYPNFDYNSIGIPASIQAVFVLPGATPNLSTSHWTSLNNTNSLHKHNFQTNYHFAGSVTKNAGKWTLKAGAEYRVDLFSDPNIYEGSVTFNGGSYTSQYVDAFGNNTVQDTTAVNQGYYEASLLRGAGSLGITPGQSVVPSFADKYVALYSQNDWRATSRLTVNLGLRWDVQPAVTERYNQISSLDQTQMNPFGTPGTIAFAGTNGYSRHLWDTHLKDFGPRAGIAYKVSDTFVVRGGYGITYIPTNTGLLHGPFNFGAAPFSTYLNQIPYGTSPSGVPIGTFSDPAVSVPVRGPGANPAAPQNYGTGPNLFQRVNYQDGRVQQWNFFLEKRLPGSWIASIGYTGTHGDRLPITRFPVVSTGLLSQAFDDCYRSGTNCPTQDSDLTGRGYVQTGKDPANDPVPNPWNPNGTLPFGGVLAAKTIPRYVRDSQYPMFVGATSSYSFGWSNYNSMIIEVKHGYSHGLQLDAHYTWSKALDFTGSEAANAEASSGVGFDSAARDLRNFNNNYHLSYSDIPHRFVVTAVYELPFGPGKHFQLGGNRVLKGIAGGWKIGAVGLIQSGFPVPIDGGDSGALNSRPFRVAGEPLTVPSSLQHWYDGKTTVTLPDGRQITPCANCYLLYNVDAFAGSVVPDPNNAGKYLNNAYYVGDAAITYSDIRAPGRSNLDLSVSRLFKVTERISLEFSAHATNALNNAQFGGSFAGSGGYNMNLGGINVTPPGAGNPSNTQLGQGTGSTTFGTYGLGTYDPRQIELGLKIRF